MLSRSPGVVAFIQGLATEVRAEVDEALAYLDQHGRAAVLPDVRHRIQTSRHYPDMGEVRVELPSGACYRILFVFDPADTPVLLVAGDKAGNWVGWYDAAIPQADDLFDLYLDAYHRSIP